MLLKLAGAEISKSFFSLGPGVSILLPYLSSSNGMEVCSN